jgi:hypothetical protein
VPFGGRRTPQPLLALRRQRSQQASRISSHPLSFQAPIAAT